MDTATLLDERDSAILASRIARFAALDGPREGDYVRFRDGTLRRVSFVTPAEWLPEIDCVQTSDGGSFYLGDYGMSFSGALYPGVRRDTLTLTDESEYGSAWIFHHDYHRASNGVGVEVPVRVYACSEKAPQ